MMILNKVSDKHLEDSHKIKQVLMQVGIDESLKRCETLWQHISAVYYNVDWLKLPDDDKGLLAIIQHTSYMVE